MEALPLWMHTIDLGGGVVTPGAWTPEDQAGTLGALEQIDFRSKKVLDVGCLDGLWSFEAERRGAAEVYATDLVSQVTPNREPYFRLAHELLGSRARYVEGQVIDAPEAYARFFYREHYLGDRSNWWIPTIPCLREWVESSFFEIEEEYRQTYFDMPLVEQTGRVVLRARAVERTDPNIAFPERELERFDLNRYG